MLINRSKLYDLIYDKADKLLKEFNPCDVHKTLFGDIFCKCRNFCCCDCDYLSEKGCTVKALYCKLWRCDASYYHNNLGVKYKNSLDYQLNKLLKIAKKYNLLIIRGTKEDIFNKELQVCS